MTDLERWLFIDPPTHHFERDRLFGTGITIQGGGIDPFAAFAFLRSSLEERNVRVHTVDLIDELPEARGRNKVVVSIGGRERYRQLSRRSDVILSSFFAFECPVVEPSLYRELYPASRLFRRIFSYSTEEGLEPFLTGPVTLSRFQLPQAYDEVDDQLWRQRDRKHLVMINGNKFPPLTLNELYTERLRGLEFFARHDEIDLYGVGWDGPVLRVGDSWLPSPLRRAQHAWRKRWHVLHPPQNAFAQAIRKTYRGSTDDKAATLANYTFALCFENSILEGWVTEKIFDCFYTGTIPIYWGAPDIDDWVPPECYIDMRRFDCYEDLREFLQGLSPEDIERYRVAAREYMTSEMYRPFTKRAFAELIGSLVEEDAGSALEVHPYAGHS